MQQCSITKLICIGCQMLLWCHITPSRRTGRPENFKINEEEKLQLVFTYSQDSSPAHTSDGAISFQLPCNYAQQVTHLVCLDLDEKGGSCQKSKECSMEQILKRKVIIHNASQASFKSLSPVQAPKQSDHIQPKSSVLCVCVCRVLISMALPGQ